MSSRGERASSSSAWPGLPATLNTNCRQPNRSLLPWYNVAVPSQPFLLVPTRHEALRRHWQGVEGGPGQRIAFCGSVSGTELEEPLVLDSCVGLVAAGTPALSFLVLERMRGMLTTELL